MLRRRDAQQNVRLEDGARQVAGDEDVRRKGEARQIRQVFAHVVELFGQRDGVRPEDQLVSAATRQRESQRCAPGSRAQNGDSAHAAAFFEPKRFSVPESRRLMLAWCFTMMSSGMKISPAMTMGVRSWMRLSATSGSSAEPMIEASETYRVMR